MPLLPTLSLLLSLLACGAIFRLYAWRATLSLKTLSLMFGLGAVGASVASLYLQNFPMPFLERDGETWRSVVGWTTGPLYEELFKAAPAIILMLSARVAGRMSVADFALAGFAGGLGFAFVELNMSRVISGSITEGWEHVWALGYSTAEDGQTTMYWPGHYVYSALVGLALGVGARLWPDDPRRWAPGLALLAFATFQHIVWNYVIRHSASALIQPEGIWGFLYGLTLNGLLEIVLLPVAVIAASAWETNWLAARGRTTDEALALPGEDGRALSEIRRAWERATYGRVAFARLTAYFRSRRAVALAEAEAAKAPGDPVAAGFAALARQELAEARPLVLDPERGSWRPSGPAKGALAATFKRFRVLIVLAVLAALFFAVAPKFLPWLHAAWLRDLFVLAGAGMVVWRVLVYRRAKRPDPASARGEVLATRRLQFTLLCTSATTSCLSLFAVFLHIKGLTPGVEAYVIGHFSRWADQGGSPEALLALAAAFGSVLATPDETDDDAIDPELLIKGGPEGAATYFDEATLADAVAAESGEDTVSGNDTLAGEDSLAAEEDHSIRLEDLKGYPTPAEEAGAATEPALSPEDQKVADYIASLPPDQREEMADYLASLPPEDRAGAIAPQKYDPNSPRGIMERAKAGDPDAIRQWEDLNGKSWAERIDEAISDGLSVVAPAAAAVYDEIGGLETLREAANLDWGKEVKDTASALHTAAQNRMDRVVQAGWDAAEAIAETASKTVDGIRDLSTMDMDELRGMGGQLKEDFDNSAVGQGLEKAADAVVAVSEMSGQELKDAAAKVASDAADKVAEVGGAIADKAVATVEGARQLVEGMTLEELQSHVERVSDATKEGLTDAQRAARRKLQELWRTDPDAARKALAEGTIAVGEELVTEVATAGMGTVAKRVGDAVDAFRAGDNAVDGVRAADAVGDGLRGVDKVGDTADAARTAERAADARKVADDVPTRSPDQPDAPAKPDTPEPSADPPREPRGPRADRPADKPPEKPLAKPDEARRPAEEPDKPADQPDQPPRAAEPKPEKPPEAPDPARPAAEQPPPARRPIDEEMEAAAARRRDARRPGDDADVRQEAPELEGDARRRDPVTERPPEAPRAAEPPPSDRAARSAAETRADLPRVEQPDVPAAKPDADLPDAEAARRRAETAEAPRRPVPERPEPYRAPAEAPKPPEPPRHGPDRMTGADSNDVGRQVRSERATERYSPVEEGRARGEPPNTELPHGPRTGDIGPDGRHPIRMSPEEARKFREEMGHHLPESPPAGPPGTRRYPEADMPGELPGDPPRTTRHPEAQMPSDLPGDPPGTRRYPEAEMPGDRPGDPPRTARHPEAEMPSDLPGDPPGTKRFPEAEMPPETPAPSARPGVGPPLPGGRTSAFPGGGEVIKGKDGTVWIRDKFGDLHEQLPHNPVGEGHAKIAGAQRHLDSIRRAEVPDAVKEEEVRKAYRQYLEGLEKAETPRSPGGQDWRGDLNPDAAADLDRLTDPANRKSLDDFRRSAGLEGPSPARAPDAPSSRAPGRSAPGTPPPAASSEPWSDADTGMNPGRRATGQPPAPASAAPDGPPPPGRSAEPWSDAETGMNPGRRGADARPDAGPAAPKPDGAAPVPPGRRHDAFTEGDTINIPGRRTPNPGSETFAGPRGRSAPSGPSAPSAPDAPPPPRTGRFPEADMPPDGPGDVPKTARYPEADMPPGDTPGTARYPEPDLPPDGPGDPPATGRRPRAPRGPDGPDGGSGGAGLRQPEAPAPEPVHVGPDRSAPTPVRAPGDRPAGMPEREPVMAGGRERSGPGEAAPGSGPRASADGPGDTPGRPDNSPAPPDDGPAPEAAEKERPRPGPRRSRAERLKEQATIPEPDEFRLDDPSEMHQRPTIREPTEFDPTAPDPVPLLDRQGNPTRVNKLVPGQPNQLERMEGYRSPQNKIHADSVNDYAQQMINGDWDWTRHPERPIIEDGDILVSGNHRMTAARMAADATGRSLKGGLNPIIPDGAAITKAEALERGLLQKEMANRPPAIAPRDTRGIGVVEGRKPPPINVADPEADRLLEGVRKTPPPE